jgi:hypothetical protein
LNCDQRLQSRFRPIKKPPEMTAFNQSIRRKSEVKRLNSPGGERSG